MTCGASYRQRNNVTVCGVVYYYRGTSPEIVPRSVEEIRVEGLIGEAREIDISELSAYVGEYVMLADRLTKIKYDSPMYTYLLYLSSDESCVRAVGRCERSILVSAIDPWIVGGWIKAESLRTG